MKTIKTDGGISLGRCILNLLTAFAVTVILVMGFALVLCYSDLSEEWISRGAKAITLFSVGLAGALCAKSGRRRGWLMGGICGLLYMAVLYIAGYLVFGEFEFGAQSVMRIIYGVLAGIIGGIIGINLKRK